MTTPRRYINPPNTQSGPHISDSRFTIRISSLLGRGTQQEQKRIVVYSPLPENFGFTVGSEFTAPFDSNFVSGSMQKAFALSGVASKTGTSTKKMYSNPEPTEISFEMSFEAYQNAFDDVMTPVIHMMALAIGRRMELGDAGAIIDEAISAASRLAGVDRPSISAEAFLTNEDSQVIDTTGRIFGFLNFVSSPPITRIRFGNVITFSNAYITSVAPQFSNVLDSSGIPMSATVSVTSILEEDPTINDDNFTDFFTRGGIQ